MPTRLLLALLVSSALAGCAAPAPPRPADAPPAPVAAGEFPADWFWDIGGSAERWKPLVGKPPPPLAVKDWVGLPQSLETLRKEGKVVIVDFWGTWCGPCRAALPKLAALAAEHPEELVIIGVHDAKRGVDRMVEVAGGAGVLFPLAVDDDGKSERAWGVSFWPTVAAIDRSGNLRAIGLKPDQVGEVVEKLLAEPAPVRTGAAAAAESPDLSRFHEGDPARRAKLADRFASGDAPAIESPEWLNSPPLALGDLRGRVVVLDFWATWCGPCLASVPRNNEIFRRFGDRIAFIGVCHPRGGERMAETVRDRGIEFPVCRLEDRATLDAYAVDGFPDYYLIDRHGKLRIADCRNADVEEAIEALLAE